MKTLLLIACISLVSCGQTPQYLATSKAIAEAPTEPNVLYVIHAPKTSCPDGWQVIPKGFLEKDGTYQAACATGTGRQGGTMDYLNPGEKFPGLMSIWALGCPNGPSS